MSVKDIYIFEKIGFQELEKALEKGIAKSYYLKKPLLQEVCDKHFEKCYVIDEDGCSVLENYVWEYPQDPQDPQDSLVAFELRTFNRRYNTTNIEPIAPISYSERAYYYDHLTPEQFSNFINNRDFNMSAMHGIGHRANLVHNTLLADEPLADVEDEYDYLAAEERDINSLEDPNFSRAILNFGKTWGIPRPNEGPKEIQNDFGIGLGLWILGGGLGLFFFSVRWYKGVRENRRIREVLNESDNKKLSAKSDDWYNTLVVNTLRKPEKPGAYITRYSPVDEQVGLFVEYCQYLRGLTKNVLKSTITEISSLYERPENIQAIFNETSLDKFLTQTHQHIDDLVKRRLFLRSQVKNVSEGLKGFEWDIHKTITPLVLMPARLPVGQKQKVLKVLEKKTNKGNTKHSFLYEFFKKSPGEQITLCRSATNDVIKKLYENDWIAPIQKKHPYFNLDEFMGHVVKEYHKLYFDMCHADYKLRGKFFAGLRHSDLSDTSTKDLYEFAGYRFILFSSFLEEKKLAKDLKYRFETVMNIFPAGINSREFQDKVISYITSVDGPRSEAEISRIKADFFEKHPNKARFVMESVISPDSYADIPLETFEQIALTYGHKVWFVSQSNTLRQKLNDFSSQAFEGFDGPFEKILQDYYVSTTPPKITVKKDFTVPLFRDLQQTLQEDDTFWGKVLTDRDHGIQSFCAQLAQQL